MRRGLSCATFTNACPEHITLKGRARSSLTRCRVYARVCTAFVIVRLRERLPNNCSSRIARVKEVIPLSRAYVQYLMAQDSRNRVLLREPASLRRVLSPRDVRQSGGGRVLQRRYVWMHGAEIHRFTQSSDLEQFAQVHRDLHCRGFAIASCSVWTLLCFAHGPAASSAAQYA